jgi:hypothetical protein
MFTDHDTLEVTVTGCVEPPCGKDKELVLTVREGLAAN